jgi:Papain family cysteine protease
MTITVHADLSAAFGPTRSQGDRPTCLAFAMSDLNRFHAGSSVLSAEYLYRGAASKTLGWQPGDGTYLRHAIAVTAAPGLPDEGLLPYEAQEPTLPMLALPTPSDGTFYSNAFAGGAPLPSATVKAMLGKGVPVGLVIKLTPGFVYATNGLIDFSQDVFPDELHAVIATATGTRDGTSAKYIRIRNSWGAGWGDSGYAWLQTSYIDAYTVETFRI